MKSFWKSRNLFSKRFLAAGGQGCVKVAQDVRFWGRHGDLPLRKRVGATLCGRPVSMKFYFDGALRRRQGWLDTWVRIEYNILS